MSNVKMSSSTLTSRSPTRVIPPDPEEMGETAVCRLITQSIRLLTDYSSSMALCGAPGPRATGMEPMLHILEVLWVLSFFFFFFFLFFWGGGREGKCVMHHNAEGAVCGTPIRACLSFLPFVCLSLHLSSLSLVYGTCTPTQYFTHILRDQPVNSNHDFWVHWTSSTDIGPVGEHTEKRTSDFTGVHIFKCCKT